MKICKAYFTFMKAMRKPEPDREREGDFDEKQNRRDQKARGMNQEELAKALGVSRQTISSLENGRYNPSVEPGV